MKIHPDDPILTAYVLDELDAHRRAQVEAGLRDSPPCRRALEDIRETTALVSSSLAAEPCPELDATQKQSVLASVPQEVSLANAARVHWRGWLRWKPALILGGITAACAAAVLISQDQSGPPATDPGLADHPSGSVTTSVQATPSLAPPAAAGTPRDERPRQVSKPAETLTIAGEPPRREVQPTPLKPDSLPPAGTKQPEAPPPIMAAAPLVLKLPMPSFKGTPPDLPQGPQIEPLTDKPRPAFLAPAGVTNLALNKKVTSSDKSPITGSLSQITDGNKEAIDDAVVELHKNAQWVQVDLEQEANVYAIVIWHDHRYVQTYRCVVAQAADDLDFTRNVQTLFNNDFDNTAGLGAGKEKRYFETNQGKLIDAKGIKTRYLRFYSKGSDASALNCYTEIEVYGLPAEAGMAPLPLTLPGQ